MKLVKGIWFPDEEVHLAEFKEILEKGSYQYDRIAECHRLGSQRKEFNYRTFIDVGAHVGLWSMFMVKWFKKIEAFEPIPAHRECFIKNVQPRSKTKRDKIYDLWPFALGNENKSVQMKWDGENTGHTHIDPEGKIEAYMKTLDSFNFQDVDLIKVDTEGFEKFVLEGAVKTIETWHPLICIEQKKFGYYGIEHDAGVKFLESMGYEVVKQIHADYIMRHKDDSRIHR